jgi:hypothetical protein
MKITDLRLKQKNTRARVVATVTWEDCNRPTEELYFETDEEFAQDLCCNPNAFLVACTIPAMHYGEKRVHLDAEICPELLVGLRTAIEWLHHWYAPEHDVIRIETKTKSDFPARIKPERAGFFYSGGIDSFATLRANRLNFPAGHPWSIRDGFLVYGLEMDDPEAFSHVLNSLSDAADCIGITLIPVYTNIYLNYRREDAANDFRFWEYEFQGAALAAIAHAFRHRVSVVSIPSSDDISNLHPYGSHPLLDPNYSSCELRIRHDGITLSRFDKTKLISDWDVALKHLRVCNLYKLYQAGKLNCGRCEKCIRTAVALLALDVLDKTNAFIMNDISEEIFLSALRLKEENYYYHQELLNPLTEKGRCDLTHIIEKKIADYHKCTKRQMWKQRIEQFDSKYLNNSLLGLKKLASFRRPKKTDTSLGRSAKA